MMNPFSLFKLKGLLNAFRDNHPKMLRFFVAAGGYIAEDSVIEIKVKNPAGEELLANIKVTQQDIELFHAMKDLAVHSANSTETPMDPEHLQT